jgi:ABC-type nickel/cobalt efflux system permease component RcnA
MTAALLLTAFTLGLRHGVDWDHIAAVTDLSGTAETRRRGLLLSLLYAVGHGAVVFVLGVAAIAFGATIPDGVDTWMGAVVGATLIALGCWVLVGLARHGRDFRLRSRWMLMLNGTFAGLRRVKQRAGHRQIEVEHAHPHAHVDGGHEAPTAHDHAHLDARAGAETEVDVLTASATGARSGASGSWLSRRTEHWPRPMSGRHTHSHRHELAVPDTADARYLPGTATGIGMLHGVGVESPTQIAVFVVSTAAVGRSAGLLLLICWIVGLIMANMGLAVLAGFGLLHAERNFHIYAGVAIVVAVSSIVMGTLLAFDLDLLPEIPT